MADTIGSVGSVRGPDYSRISQVRRYTEKEKDALMEKLEDDIKHQAEIQTILQENPTPEGVTFAELVEKIKNGQSLEEDEGVIVDIRGNR